MVKNEIGAVLSSKNEALPVQGDLLTSGKEEVEADAQVRGV